MYRNQESQWVPGTGARKLDDWEFDEFDADDLDFDFDEFDDLDLDDAEFSLESPVNLASSPDSNPTDLDSEIDGELEQKVPDSSATFLQSRSLTSQSPLFSPSHTVRTIDLTNVLKEIGLPIPKPHSREHPLSAPDLDKARGELQQLSQQLETAPFPGLPVNPPTIEEEFNTLFASVHTSGAACLTPNPPRPNPLSSLGQGIQGIARGIQSAGQWGLNVCTKTVQITAIFITAFFAVDLAYNYASQCERAGTCIWSGDRLSSLFYTFPLTTSPSPDVTDVDIPASAFNPFHEAVNQAMSAAELTQVANTADQWNLVASRWLGAIILMRAVPSTDPRYELAQSKVEEYSKNLAYAQQRAEVAAEKVESAR
jgi:hypothetical protein